MFLRKITKQSVQFYLISFLIPICIYGIIILSYQFGAGDIYVNSFSYTRILMSGLASMALAYYLRHTTTFQLSGKLAPLAFAASYGLSSYILAQEGNFLTLLIYSLFPILFLTYEWMITDRKHIPFIIGNAIILLAYPLIGIPVTILLYLLSFFELSLQKRFHFGDFIHTTCNFLLSILAGSFGIVFYLAPCYADHETYAYEGFQIVTDFTIFLSRFLPGSVPSQQFFFQINKIDLYLSMTALILAILFFFQHRIPSRKRLYYAIFTLVLIAGIELTPLQYILNLLTIPNRDTITYSFILIFWTLRLASESYCLAPHTKKSSIIITACMMAVIISISWCFGQHNFLSWMLAVHIVLCGIILMSLLFTGKHHSPAHKLIFSLLLIELSFNTIIVTNFKARPKNTSVQASFFYNKNHKSHKKTNPETPRHAQKQSMFSLTSEEYQDYIQAHTNETTNQVLNDFYDYYQEDNNSTTSIANYFEECNINTHKLGITDDLFTACDITITFPDNPVYSVTDLGHNIFHITCPDKGEIIPGYIPYTIQTKKQEEDPIYLWSNSNYDIIELDHSLLTGTQPAYLQVTDSDVASYKYQILSYSMDKKVLNQISSLLSQMNPSDDKGKQSFFIYDIIGMVFSYLGAMLLLVLLFYNDKEKLYCKLYQIRKKLSHASPVQWIANHFQKNKLYYLAFILPCLLLLCIYICTDCMPFGDNTIFDEDGSALVFPEYMDFHYNTLDGNTNLSMHSGYATNNYNNTPLIKLYQFYQYLSPSQILILQHWILLLCIGFAGTAMVFYLTHRQTRPASKQNLCLLLPAMIYSTNAYMLRCHSFNSWYYLYPLFPILLIAFQRLLAQKKWFAYTALLACSIILNIQLGLYICIFLVICFFCQQFSGIRDFIRKGIRFTWTSLLAAGCSFFVISNTLIATQVGGYQKTDAHFPKPGLHGNFLTEWKNYMICSPVNFVSNHDGDLFAYCGIITLLLSVVYFINRKYTLQDKLRRAIPILFLSISFNGQVLSYLWNGLHYQSNVPNRYTFLLMFLFAEIAYDAIHVFPNLTRLTYTYLILGMTVFFLSCQSYSNGNTAIAFSITIILCFCYLALHLWYKQNHAKKHLYITILLSLGVLELYSNGLYTGNKWGVSSLMRYGEYETLMDNTIGTQENNKNFYRCIFPAKFMLNAGKAFHTNSSTAFNSYVSKYQGNLNTSNGFLSGTNYTCNYYISNPMGLSLAANKYIYVQAYNSKSIPNLRQYPYLGYYDGFYIFENPYYLSLGFHVPESALHYNEKQKNMLTKTPLLYQNYLAKEYLAREQNINAMHPITVSYTATNQADRFYFTDENNNVLTMEELNKVYEKLGAYEEYKLKLHINFSVPCDGYLYLYINEIIGLDYVHKGEIYQTTIDFPDSDYSLFNSYYMAVFKEDVFQEFYQKARQNQLEDITIQHDTITGTTNYDEDGYTMLSIAYDKGWTAYIDGKETPIENPYDAGIYIKTPAGRHTLTLKFVPYGMKTSQMITCGFWILTILLALCGRYLPGRLKSNTPQ